MDLIVEKLMDVGIRELRGSLSRHLVEVRAGRTITVTDHGHPIARIVPIGEFSKFDQLVAEGRIIPAEKPRGALPTPVKADAPVSDFIAEQRR
jgi:prevent-host-death family protein